MIPARVLPLLECLDLCHLARLVREAELHLRVGAVDPHQLILDPLAPFHREAEQLLNLLGRRTTTGKQELHQT